MNHAPSQYKPLREYLAVLKAHRVMIGVVAALAVVIALALSLTQTPKYDATAALSFQDQSQALGLIGVPVAQVNTPAQLAQTAAQTLVTPALLSSVQRTLGTRQTIGQLQGELSTAVQPSTSLLNVTAASRSPEFAARLANAVAEAAVSSATDLSHRSLAASAHSLQERLSRTHDPTTRAALADRISQLESLSIVTDPVTVAQTAQVPSSPASPKPVSDALIALILGLLLGVVLAFARNSLDRRLHGAHEIRQSLTLPLLGYVRNDVMGHVALPTANGNGPVTAVDLESFRIMRANLEFLDSETTSQVIAITSGLPDEGKSTVAASLAVASAVAGKRTLLIECDLRRPTLSDRLGVERVPGLVEYLTDTATPQEILRSVVVASGRTGEHDKALTCILSGDITAQPAELLASPKFHSLLNEVRQVYDLIVLDTSPLLPVADTLEIIPEVDVVILCVRALQTTRQQAAAAKAALDRLPDKPRAVVATGVRLGTDDAYGYYAYDYAYTAET